MSKKYFFRRGIYEIRELEKGVRNGFTETAKMRSICVLRKQEKVQQTCLFAGLLAESEGFEPSVGINQHGFSRAAPSTARTTLRMFRIFGLLELLLELFF